MGYTQLLNDNNIAQQWKHSFAKELGQLTQGFEHTHGTNTMSFIPFEHILHQRRSDITYGKLVVDYKPSHIRG